MAQETILLAMPRDYTQHALCCQVKNILLKSLVKISSNFRL